MPDEFDIEMKKEDLVLCHGTSQPIGNVVELEARANPNGEPVPALNETAGIWAADYISLCRQYAMDTGMVVGDSERFRSGTESQIYHFDLKTKSGYKPRGGGSRKGAAPAEIRRFAKQARK